MGKEEGQLEAGGDRIGKVGEAGLAVSGVRREPDAAWIRPSVLENKNG